MNVDAVAAREAVITGPQGNVLENDWK